MDFLERLLGVELGVMMRTVIAFAVVLGLIVLVAWLFRRISRGGARTRRGRLTRLAVLEAIQIDPRRRLVLFRRDNTEHLILIGGSSDVVVEQGIHRAPRQAAARVPDRKEPAMRPQPPGRPSDQPPPPAPQPAERPIAEAPPPAGARPAPLPPDEDADDSVTDRQLADMADRLKAALREPQAPGAPSGGERKSTPAETAEKAPARPGGTRRSE